MSKIKPIIARSPEDLARALGLSAAEAKEWQVQRALLKRLKVKVFVRSGEKFRTAHDSGQPRT
jgi:hypothetical protein